MRTYFPDTNFFFECRKAGDLPWHELDPSCVAPGPDIRLIVPPTVIMEIERHKSRGNSRNARRAREASALFRQALTSQEHEVELRREKPRVILALPPVLKTDIKDFPGLDETRPDHRIAAEYAKLLEKVPELVPLSDDTLLVLALRSLSFAPVLIPETWKLAPEKDERDDEIEKLRGEVRTLKTNLPEMSLAVLGPAGEVTSDIRSFVEIIEASSIEIAAAVRNIESVFPMASEFERSSGDLGHLGAALRSGLTFIPVRNEDIESYKRDKYPRWLEEVRRLLPTLVSRQNIVANIVPFCVEVRNDGFANADFVRVTVSSYDGVLVHSLGPSSDEEEDWRVSIPEPPTPPASRYISLLQEFHSPNFRKSRQMNSIFDQPLKVRNPNSFYFVDGHPQIPTDELVLTCDAFPHQSDRYELGFRLFLPHVPGPMPRVRVRLEARNLRKPIDKFVKVSITRKAGDFGAFVAQLVQDLRKEKRSDL